MDRIQALQLVHERAEKDVTVRHLISVEGVMRSLAQRFGADVDQWGLVGLFHDLDMELTHDDLERHAYLAATWLREAGVEEPIVNGVLAHAHPQFQTDLLSRAIVPADAVSGFLVACALVRPDRARGMKVSSCRKKLRERSFAPGVERDHILGCQERIGIDVDELLALGIRGLEMVAEEIGLGPAAG